MFLQAVCYMKINMKELRTGSIFKFPIGITILEVDQLECGVPVYQHLPCVYQILFLLTYQQCYMIVYTVRIVGVLLYI